METLSPEIKRALEELGFKQLTEIQTKAIALGRENKNFWARSPTGTGKTAAFLVPLIERAAKNPKYKALILEPSRELAIQVANDSRKISAHTSVRTLAAYGGTNPEAQEKIAASGAQIIVATPERASSLLKRTIPPEQIQALVLDEADRLLTFQFKKELYFIASILPKTRQTILLSVHAPAKQVEYAKIVLNVKDFEQAKAGALPEAKIEHEYEVAKNKFARFAQLCAENPKKAIAFFATVEDLQTAVRELGNHKIHAIPLHSQLKAEVRNNAVKKFREQPHALLLTTDLAARGMHFPEITQIYSVGVAPTPEFYPHRAGRTGRMRSQGTITSIISQDEEKKFKQICAAIGITPAKKQ